MNKQHPTFTGEVKEGKVLFYDKAKYQLWIDSLDSEQVEVTIKKYNKRRTGQQNNAMHEYFDLLASALNNAGYSVKKTLRRDVDIDWTPYLIKELIWRPVQRLVVKKESTASLSKTKEIEAIYDTINRFLSEKTGVSVEFPRKEERSEE